MDMYYPRLHYKNISMDETNLTMNNTAVLMNLYALYMIDNTLDSLDLTDWIFMERGSSVVERRTRNQVTPGSNPPLLPFRRLGTFVLSIDAPVDSAV